MTRPLTPVVSETPSEETDAPSIRPSAPLGIRLGSLAHLGGILLFVPALIIWLFARSDRTIAERRFAEGEAKEALNWQISFAAVLLAGALAAGLVEAVLYFTPLRGIDTVLNVVPWLMYAGNVASSVLAFRTARTGAVYRYPISLRLVK